MYEKQMKVSMSKILLIWHNLVHADDRQLKLHFHCTGGTKFICNLVQPPLLPSSEIFSFTKHKPYDH